MYSDREVGGMHSDNYEEPVYTPPQEEVSHRRKEAEVQSERKGRDSKYDSGIYNGSP